MSLNDSTLTTCSIYFRSFRIHLLAICSDLFKRCGLHQRHLQTKVCELYSTYIVWFMVMYAFHLQLQSYGLCAVHSGSIQTPALDFFHILLLYSLILKWIKYIFLQSTRYKKCTHTFWALCNETWNWAQLHPFSIVYSWCFCVLIDVHLW
jgi:hypothetical protein